MTWRRGRESNPRIKVLQTSALPLGYHAGAIQLDIFMERVTGVGPVSPPWQGDVIPLYHTRLLTILTYFSKLFHSCLGSTKLIK